MLESKKEIDSIIKQINEKLMHPYLAEYVNIPQIDEDKIIFLYSIYETSEIPKEVWNSYIISTMLVQIALDTHEQVVPNVIDENDFEQKSRQLTVLAGDYFSGLYYDLLAKIDDIEMIRSLADAVKTINEYKIYVYQNEVSNAEFLIKALSVIDSHLIQKAALFMDAPLLGNIISDFFLLKRFLKEKKQLFLEGKSHTIEILHKYLKTNDNLQSVCDDYINRTKQSLHGLYEKSQDLTKLQKNIIENLLYDQKQYVKK